MRRVPAQNLLKRPTRRGRGQMVRMSAVAVLALALTGCMVLPITAAKTLTTEQVDNAVKIIKETEGTGCVYARGVAVVGPGQGALDVVGTIGKGLDYTKCLEALRARPEI